MSNEKIKQVQKTYTVELSESNAAAMRVITQVGNGNAEITIIKGQITVIKPVTQRIDLQRQEERDAIISGLAPGGIVDMSKWLDLSLKVQPVEIEILPLVNTVHKRSDEDEVE